MKILGYLVVLALFGGNNKYNNFSIEVQKVRQLVKDIFKNNEITNETYFTKDDLRRGNLINKGTVAKYYSKAVRDYIIYHNVSSEEEGFVLTFHNFNAPPSVPAENKNVKNKEKDPTVIFIPKEGVDVNDAKNKDLREVIAKYIDTVQEKINTHEIGSAPTKSDLLEVDFENNHLSVHPTKQNGTEVPKELSKSRVYNLNKAKEDATKITKNLSEEKNSEVSKHQNKTNEHDDHLSIVPQEEVKISSFTENKTGDNKETKNNDDITKFLHDSKTGINPVDIEIKDKNEINELKSELNTDSGNISSTFVYENTPKLNETIDTTVKDQNSTTHNKTSNFLSINYDKIVENKPDDLKIIEDKFKNKIKIVEENYGNPDVLNKQNNLFSDIEQKIIKEDLSKIYKNNTNDSFNNVEEKDTISKIPKVSEKSDEYLKTSDTDNIHNDLISNKTINDYKNEPENKTIAQEKGDNSFESITSKGKEHESKLAASDESKPAISKDSLKSDSTNTLYVDNFKNKTEKGNEKPKVSEELIPIKLNGPDKSHEEKKSPADKLKNKAKVNQDQVFQISEFTEKYHNKDIIENETNSKINKDNPGNNCIIFKFNRTLTKEPSFDTSNEENSELINKNEGKPEDNQNVRKENHQFDPKDSENPVTLNSIETDTVGSQEQTSYETTSEWNNEEKNNSEEDAENEINRAQEQGISIEVPDNDESTSRSSDEDDWEVTDDYEE